MKLNPKLLLGILFVIILILLGGVVYRFSRKVPSEPPTLTSVLEVNDTWKTFEDTELGISFQYPPDWQTTDKFGRIISLLETEDVEQLRNDPDYNALPALKVGFYESAASLNGNDGKPTGATSLQNYLETYKSDVGPVFSYEARKIGQYDGYLTDEPNIGGFGYYYIERGGRIWLFVFDYNNQPVVDIILSTLVLK